MLRAAYHALMSALKALASLNIVPKFTTRLTVHEETSPLKMVQDSNMPENVVAYKSRDRAKYVHE